MERTALTDEFAIRRVVERWAIFRDSGQFDRMPELWHENGRMVTTWSQLSATDFIQRSSQAFANGVNVQHFLGGTAVDISGDRAIAQTKMSINQRGPIDGILCDVLCVGRFYDFFAYRNGRWAIVLRQPIYEKDRLDTVDPAAHISLEPELLAKFPDAYQHLGYLQTKLGMTVKADLPGLKGELTDAVYARGEAWLNDPSFDIATVG